MLHLRLLYASALLAGLLPFTLAETLEHSTTSQKNPEKFEQLLSHVSTPSLHEALVEHVPVFREGIFQADREAAVALHEDDPPLASQVIEAARLDLVKRQDGNANNVTSTSTTSTAETSTQTSIQSSSPSPSSSPTPSSSTPTPTPTPPQSTQTPSSIAIPPHTSPSVVASVPPLSSVAVVSSKSQVVSSQVSVVSQASSSAGAGSGQGSQGQGPIPTPSSSATPSTIGIVPVSSSPPVVTSTPVITSTSVTTPATTMSGPVVVTTDQFGNVLTLSGATDGAVITTTDAAGRIVTTTYHPGGGVVSSTVVQATTLANGQPSTLTSIAVIAVTGQPSNTQAPGPASQASTGQPGLVTGNVAVMSRKVGKEVVALLGGAVGVAWLL